MLKIEGNYLSVAGIKFILPQGFYIDIESVLNRQNIKDFYNSFKSI